MLLNGNQLQTHFWKVLLNHSCIPSCRASIYLCNDEKCAAGLQYSCNAANIGRQIRPPEVSFNSSNQVKRGFSKRQIRNGNLANFYAVRIDQVLVYFACNPDTR